MKESNLGELNEIEVIEEENLCRDHTSVLKILPKLLVVRSY